MPSATRLARGRASRWRSRRTRSSSERTGRGRGDPGRVPGTSRPHAAFPSGPGGPAASWASLGRARHDAGKVGTNVPPRDLPGRAGHPDEVPPRRNLLLQRCDRGPEAATDAVPLDRGACLSRQGKGHPDPACLRGGHGSNPQAPLTAAAPLPAEPGELLSTGDRADQADRRWRPLARRDFRTARPALVDIRARNPCFLDRRRLFGWNVRFTGPSSRALRVVVISCSTATSRHGLRTLPVSRSFFPSVDNLLRSRSRQVPIRSPHRVDKVVDRAGRVSCVLPARPPRGRRSGRSCTP